MENYSEIIESLNVQFGTARAEQVEHAFTIQNFSNAESVFMHVTQGGVYFGNKKEPVRVDDVLFVPSGRETALSFSEPNPDHVFENEYSQEEYRKYMRPLDSNVSKTSATVIHTYHIDAKVFNAVNLFKSLDILPFVIKNDKKIVQTLQDIFDEASTTSIGRLALLQCKSLELVTRVLRHVLDRRIFVQQITTHGSNLRDERLVVIFKYINDNLDGDLSNKCLAVVAAVSEDYVGQYFKALTGMNPQDYIEFQRMQWAVKLLRSTSKSIREVGESVGYKDSSYFCRRFKIMFGTSASHMRRRKSVNIEVIQPEI